MPWGPDTGNVRDRDCLLRPTAREASYQGPLAIGSPRASKIFWFLLAFKIALLKKENKKVLDLDRELVEGVYQQRVKDNMKS